ncbi:MAG: mechanosensitive ion channel family protein [Candidatus Woesearchaeota archaeon]
MIQQLQEYLDFTFLANTGEQYLYALGLFLIVILGMWVFKVYVLHVLHRLAQKTENTYDDEIIELLRKVPKPFYVIIGVYVASLTLTIPALARTIIGWALVVVAVYYVVKVAQLVIEFFIDQLASARGEKKEESLLGMLASILKGLLWLIAILLILANLGVEITPLIAGLGIGGLAIAFAFQRILEDLFSSFSIYFDKPFEVGDFIIVGDDMGVVKYVGLKTTRLTTLQGQELIISNRELTSTRINNYKRMQRRRIVFEIGVEYSTPTEKLEKVRSLAEQIFKDIELVDLDRIHFKEFADSSLNYEIVYYINSSDFYDHMNAREDINFGLLKAFREEGIEFAFPTQTLHVHKEE